MFGAILVLNSAGWNCFLCAKTVRASFITARQRIGSDLRLISFSGISLAGLQTFLWVMHRNVGYNNIFLCHGGKECVPKQPSYIRSPSYFASLLQTPYFYYSKLRVVRVGFLQHPELERPSNCEIYRWVSRWIVFEGRCFMRRSQRSSPWNGLFVWSPTEG